MINRTFYDFWDSNTRVGDRRDLQHNCQKIQLPQRIIPKWDGNVRPYRDSNMVVCSTKIHQVTWLSSHRNTHNQIDHVVVYGQYTSSILVVRTLREANIGSAHNLLATNQKKKRNLCSKGLTSIQRRFKENIITENRMVFYSTGTAAL